MRPFLRQIVSATRRPLELVAALVVAWSSAASQSPAAPASPSGIIQFIVTSDVHYGITRRAFRGDTGVAAARVNAAMVAQINAVPALSLPSDSGVASGRRVGAIDFVAVTGDIANRAEKGVQPAAESWSQFVAGFVTKL